LRKDKRRHGTLLAARLLTSPIGGWRDFPNVYCSLARCGADRWLSGQQGRQQEGLVLDIVLGVVGAMVGGVLLNQFGHSGATGVNLYSIFVAIIGAVIVLLIYHLVFRRRAICAATIFIPRGERCERFLRSHVRPLNISSTAARSGAAQTIVHRRGGYRGLAHRDRDLV
jgi:uncharacterized membrane protein YeaQ/YmgE (transglycosylase-associated protein family)